MKIFQFIFNPFQVNTYVLSDEGGRAWIVDPGMYDEHEKEEFRDTLDSESLKPEAVLLTHGHVDHVLGVKHLRESYGLPVWAHKDTFPFLRDAVEHARVYGLDIDAPGEPDRLLEEDEVLAFGGEDIRCILAPGHADGSLCFHIRGEKLLLAGDVLFNGSIGRADLPTGDVETLLRSIRKKLLVLDPDTRVLCGHGPQTTIGAEAATNPFL